MYLSSLKANGFKSFADHTHLRFEPGVTAVVGPNGCGKSNIADAVRWVLGEQSAKALRGGKMQDVIFEGTDRRKPLNLCEVSITLTDCEEELGQEFNEIEISRRVTRDGGSNYFINGKACRLKDIQRLFMDTGVGRTSYSIMAQGHIDQILSSKPEERRAVFEEAAGISKYKAQRREAMNKLGHVESNLERVTDVIQEINRQIGSLRRQATKAIRYKKLSHKLRHLDVGYSAYQYRELDSALQNIDSSAGKLQSSVGELQTDLEEKEGKVVVYKEERQALIQKVQDAQQSVFDLRSMKEQIANQAHTAQIRIGSLQERVEHAREEIASFESRIGEVAGRLDEHSQDKQLHLDVLGNSDEIFQERNRELEEIEAQLASADLEIQKLKVIGQDAEREANRCREELSALEVEAGTSSNRLMRLEEELAEQSEGQSEAEAALKSFKNKIEETTIRQEDLQTRLEAARDLVSETRDEFRAAQVRIQELDRVVAQKSARVKLLQQLQEKLEGYGEGAKALLKGRMQGSLEGQTFSAIASNMSVKDGYGGAIEALLGSAVEAVSVGEASTVVEIFNQLEDRKIGRACVKISATQQEAAANDNLPDWLKSASGFVNFSDPDSDGALQSVLSASYVVEDLSAFLSWWEQNQAFRFLQVASKRGESVDCRGIATGGYRKGKNSSILQREIELRQTKEELKADQKALETARGEAEKINQRLEEAETLVETRRHEIAEANNELSIFQAEARNAEKVVQDQKLKAERLEHERELLHQTRDRANERLEAARERLADETEKLETSRAKLEETESGVTDLRSLRDERREALAQAKFDYQDKKQKLDILNQGLVEMEQRRSELNRLIESKTSGIENWEEQMFALNQEIEESRGRAASVEQELEEAKVVVDRARETLASVEEKVGILENELNDVRQQLDEQKGNLNHQQVQIAEKRSRLEFIGEEIDREYGIDLKIVDWKYELWKARQPVENLPKLDGSDDEAEQNEAPLAIADGEGGEEVVESEILPESEAESDGEPEAAEENETEASVPDLSQSKQPTPEELEALDKTNWKAIKQEVQALRKRIQNLGSVNLVAIEEYGELRERHGFLKTQYDDLVASKEKLVDAIDEINVKSREQFSTTFDQIRENFKGTFNTLFGGGKADLKLIESEDILESGIEIVAQPPGTRLKSVSLLSGGQRTMTAVGLLFAIYLVKPSPFCLLDELDAPLDESNIGRFTSLLKQFTKHSQFIIITHNKRTIAAAEAIYGVTMEEKGVSKVVSMKFNSEHENQDIVKLHLEVAASA